MSERKTTPGEPNPQDTTPENPEPAKKGLLRNLADGLVSGVKASGEALVQGANAVVDTVADSGKFVIDGIVEGSKFLWQGVEKSSHFVVDQVTGTVGYIQDGVYYVGGKAVEGTLLIKDGVLTVGETIVGSLVNTARFIGDSEYRETVGIPWLKEVIRTNRETLAYQMQQNQMAMSVLSRYASGDPSLSEEETQQATKQLTDMIRLVPALGLFLLPGGTLLLPILARLLPWELVPNLRPPTSSTETGTEKTEAEKTEAEGKSTDSSVTTETSAERK